MQKQFHRLSFKHALLIFLCTFTVQQTPALSSFTKYSLATTAAVSASLGYWYLTSPEECEPTIDTIHPVSATPLAADSILCSAQENVVPTASTPYLMQPGTAACSTNENEPLWVLASGWKPLFDQLFNCRIESAFTGLRRYLKRNIFHGPSITFVYKDNRRAFNFGQKLDQQIFNTLYRSTNNRELVLYGLCRGATTLLGWLENYENNNSIKALILESPALSLKDICQGIGKQYTNLSIQGYLLNSLFSIYFPCYHSEEGSLLHNLSNLHLSDDTPIFIGHIQDDQITTNEKVSLLVSTLRTTRKNPVYFFVCTEKLDHGKLSKSLAYQQTVNAFLKKYDLPHDAALAEQGSELLAHAEQTLGADQQTIAVTQN